MSRVWPIYDEEERERENERERIALWGITHACCPPGVCYSRTESRCHPNHFAPSYWTRPDGTPWQ